MVGGMRVWETREGVCEGGGKDGQERGSGRKVGMVLRSIAEGDACANWVEGGVQGVREWEEVTVTPRFPVCSVKQKGSNEGGDVWGKALNLSG